MITISLLNYHNISNVTSCRNILWEMTKLTNFGHLHL